MHGGQDAENVEQPTGGFFGRLEQQVVQRGAGAVRELLRHGMEDAQKPTAADDGQKKDQEEQ
jgi:hypothetical protein